MVTMRHKKIVALVTLIIISCFLNYTSHGQEQWIPFTSYTQSRPIFSLHYSNNENVSFSVETTGMVVLDVLAQEKTYQRLAIPDQNKSTGVGFPEIPVISQLIAIPECEQVLLKIIPIDSVYMEDYNVYPVPQIVEKYYPDGYSYPAEEFAINDSVYSVDHYYPNSFGKIAELASIREQQVARVEIYPIQFNPVANNLKVYTHIKVGLNFVSPKSAVVKDVGPFYKACRATILNYR
ncbi:MAG: C25 family peptidase propeptide domain-containing protein [Candidatus Zhuqueibacterota bacterium]